MQGKLLHNDGNTLHDSHIYQSGVNNHAYKHGESKIMFEYLADGLQERIIYSSPVSFSGAFCELFSFFPAPAQHFLAMIQQITHGIVLVLNYSPVKMYFFIQRAVIQFSG